jgi:hypothetical protein
VSSDSFSSLYRTSDLFYAAFLVVAGQRLRFIRVEGARRTYEFDTGAGLRGLKVEYFSGAARVGALAYGRVLRRLKRAPEGEWTS